MRKIFVFGSANTDMVVQCPHLPAPGETVLGGAFQSVQGGKGANQAVAAARLGGDVVLVCAVGGDALGDANIQAYQAEGINADHIIRKTNAASGVALIMVGAHGENMIAVAPGANALLRPHDLDSALQKIQPGDIAVFQLEIPLETVARGIQKAKQAHAAVILDPAPAPTVELPSDLLSCVDFITPNEIEAERISHIDGDPEAACEDLHQRGPKNIIITLGGQGILLYDGKSMERQPAVAAEAIDATAAGDAFSGALAVALAERKSRGEAIAFAQKAAAWSVARAGAQPSLPTRSQLESWEENA